MEATDHDSDPEAERGLLGCLLTDSAAREHLLGMLDQDCFADPLHRRLFEAMVDLCVGGWAIDPVNLARKTHLAAVEVQRYFQPAPNGPDLYLRRVIDHALRRGLAQTLTALRARGPELSFRQLLEEHAAVLQNLATRYLPTEPSQEMHQLVPEALEAIERARHHDRRREQFVATGILGLDDLTSGLRRGGLTVLAGRRGNGRTTLSLAMVSHAAISERTTVALYTNEPQPRTTAERLLSVTASVDGRRAHSGQLRGTEWLRLQAAGEHLSAAAVTIHPLDGRIPDLARIVTASQRLRRDSGLDLVVVDAMPDYSWWPKPEEQATIAARLGISLARLARDVGAAVLLVVPLFRNPATREERRPDLGDLGAAGYTPLLDEAAAVYLLYRHPQPDTAREPPDRALGRQIPAELVVARQRTGPAGSTPPGRQWIPTWWPPK